MWANKMNRLKRKVLRLPNSEVGFNLPDLELYQLATQDFYLPDVVIYSKEEQWVHSEDVPAHPQNQ